MSDSDLMTFVHKDIVYRRVPLPEEENGLTLLRAANEAVVNDDDEIGHVYYSDSDCECGQAECLSCNYDYAKVMSMLARILEKNARCLDLYAQVLVKGRVQFATPCQAPWFGGSEWDHNYALDQVKTLETRWACERGDLTEAARAVRERAQMAAITGRGDGPMGNYITAIGALRAALHGALALVEKPAITREALDELAKIEACVLDDDDLAQAARASFLIVLDAVEGFERERSLTKQIDKLLADFYLARPIGLEGEPWDDEGRLDERRRQVHFILDGHPCGWDAAETIRRLSSEYASLARPEWLAGSADEGDEVVGANSNAHEEFWQCWPVHLQPYFSIECFGDSASAIAARQQAREFGVDQEYQALTDQDLAEVREAIRKCDNPLGMLVENVQQPTEFRDLCDACQTLGETLAEKVRERRESLNRIERAL